MTGYQIIKLWIKNKYNQWFGQPSMAAAPLLNNPLKADVNNRIQFDAPNFKGNYTINKIRKYKRAAKNTFIESFIYDTFDPINGSDCVRLFFNPAQNGNYDVLALTKIDEFPYDNDFHEMLKDTQFTIEETETFTRIGLLTTPRVAAVTEIEDVDGDGKVSNAEISTENLEYWDYVNEADSKTEFLIIELQNKRYFELWKGFAVNSNNILVIQ